MPAACVRMESMSFMAVFVCRGNGENNKGPW
jgi:hypothetical protein